VSGASSPPRGLEVFAPAKINLTLAVGPLRADGRHELQSLAAFADVGDRLRLEPASGLSLQVRGPFAPALAEETDNLVLRAARLLAQAAGGAPLGAALTLEKNLPVASGIGGGSADAAAALRGLNSLWGLGWSEGALADLARSLGADVPVCVACRPALMSGAGEDLRPVAMPSLSAVLVNPGVPVSTGAVYRRFDALGLGADWPPPEPPSSFASPDESWRIFLGRDNDLSPAAIVEAPVIAAMLQRLRQDPRVKLARLSGSGATGFALTEAWALARAVAQDLTAEGRGWWIVPAQLGAVDVAPVWH
jgi:4-diphosphocytidyl-2-C-methyl-D-erythritol kinase